jgi:hypothetical protein
VNGLLGKVYQVSKLFGWNIKFLKIALEKSYESNFTSEFHPDSYFMKYLYNSSIHKIRMIDDEL